MTEARSEEKNKNTIGTKNKETGVVRGQNFSDKYLQSLRPKLSNGAEYYVRERNGFALKVYPDKSKKFYYIYETNEGKQRRMCLGTFIPEGEVKQKIDGVEVRTPKEEREPNITLAEAHERHDELKALVKAGIDPLAPPKPEPIPEPLAPEIYTVDKLIEDYIANCRLNKLADKTIYDYSRTLEHDIRPVIGKLAVESIDTDGDNGTITLIEKLVKTAGPGQARNTMKTGRSMFKFALKRKRCKFNPFSCIDEAIPIIIQIDRTRVLSDDEIKHVWAALCDREDGETGVVGTKGARAALLLTLVTAQRPGEICGMPKNEINGDWLTIDVKRIKTRKKNPFDQRVFLTQLAKWLLPEPTSGWYFPCPDEKIKRTKKVSPILENGLSKILSKPRKNKAGELLMPLFLGLPQWQPHDLRRTAVTGLSKLGCPRPVLKAIINHKEGEAIGIYDRNTYDNEKEYWLTKWSEHLETLVSTKK